MVASELEEKKGRYVKITNNNITNTSNNSIDDTLTDSDNSNSVIILPNSSCTNTIDNVNTNDSDIEDDPTPPEDMVVERRSYYQMKVEAHRWTVFNFFVHRYDGTSPPDGVELYEFWTGKGGIGSKIKKVLKLPQTFSVQERLLPIVEKIMECFHIAEKFHPKMVDNRGGNRKMTIRMDSVEAQIIADSIEAGLST